MDRIADDHSDPWQTDNVGVIERPFLNFTANDETEQGGASGRACKPAWRTSPRELHSKNSWASTARTVLDPIGGSKTLSASQPAPASRVGLAPRRWWRQHVGSGATGVASNRELLFALGKRASFPMRTPSQRDACSLDLSQNPFVGNALSLDPSQSPFVGDALSLDLSETAFVRKALSLDLSETAFVGNALSLEPSRAPFPTMPRRSRRAEPHSRERRDAPPYPEPAARRTRGSRSHFLRSSPQRAAEGIDGVRSHQEKR
jgi:hypothetical protein